MAAPSVFDTYCLHPEVFEGAGGDLIFCQEVPGINGERYVRIFVRMDRAEELCAAIMAVARKAKA